MRGRRAASSTPSSRSKSQARFCCASSLRCSLLARRATALDRLRSSLSRKVRRRSSSSGVDRSSASISSSLALREHLVAKGLGVIEDVVIRTPGLRRLGHFVAVGVAVVHVGVGRVLRSLRTARRLRLRRSRSSVGRFLAVGAFLLLLRLLRRRLRLLLLLLVAVVGLAVGGGLGEFEILQQVARDLARTAVWLSRQSVAACSSVAAPSPRSKGARRRPSSARSAGGVSAGQPLTHDQGDSVFERRLGFVGDLVVAAVTVLVLDLGGEILRHARHAVGADAFDAARSIASNTLRAGPAAGASLRCSACRARQP